MPDNSAAAPVQPASSSTATTTNPTQTPSSWYGSLAKKLGLTSSDENLTTAEMWAAMFGRGSIAAGLVSQFAFGGFYADRYLKRGPAWAQYLRFGIPPIVAFGSYIGKYFVVSYYGIDNFKKMTHFDPKKHLNPRYWGWKGFIDFSFKLLLSIPASATFSYLNYLAVTSSIEFMGDYQALKSTADVLGSSWGMEVLLSFTMIPSFYTNVISFQQGILPAAFAKLRSFGYWMVENPEFRNQRTEMQDKIRLAHQSLLDALKDHRFDKKVDSESNKTVRDYSKMLNETSTFLTGLLGRDVSLGTTDERNAALEELKKMDKQLLTEKLLAYVSNKFSESDIKSETKKTFFAKHFAGIMGTTAGIIGLINFVVMGALAADLFKIGAASLYFSALVMFSMSMLAFSAIYSLAEVVSDVRSGQKPSLNLISKLVYRALMIGTIFWTAIGGAPNAFQALDAGEGYTLQAFAFLASFLIEVYTMVTRLLEWIKERISNKSEETAFLYAIDGLLAQIREAIFQLQTESSNKVPDILANVAAAKDATAAEEGRSEAQTASTADITADDSGAGPSSDPKEKMALLSKKEEIPQYRSSYTSVTESISSVTNYVGSFFSCRKPADTGAKSNVGINGDAVPAGYGATG